MPDPFGLPFFNEKPVRVDDYDAVAVRLGYAVRFVVYEENRRFFAFQQLSEKFVRFPEFEQICQYQSKQKNDERGQQNNEDRKRYKEKRACLYI